MKYEQIAETAESFSSVPRHIPVSIQFLNHNKRTVSIQFDVRELLVGLMTVDQPYRWVALRLPNFLPIIVINTIINAKVSINF